MRSTVRRLLAATLLLLALPGIATAAVPKDARGPSLRGEWLAGDLHVHTTYSHDSWAGPSDDNTGPEEFYTFGWSVGEQGTIAAARGLDYVAITDHNDVRSQTDAAWGTEGLIWVPAYENSLPGHAQMLGATSVLDNGGDSLADVERIAAALRTAGGAFQINHPSDGEWIERYGNSFVPDTVEVWNIGVWAHQPPAPSSNDNEFSLRFWDSFLDAGHHVAATGGSDSHWRSLTPMAGVGQPTTWVFAEQPTPEGVLAAIGEGRTTISHQPPAHGGPFAVLEADRNGDETFDATVGDTVGIKRPLRARVEGAPGATLRLVTTGSEILAEVPVTSPDFTYDFTAPKGVTWVRAEVFLEDAAEVRQQLTPLCEVIDTIAGFFDDRPSTHCKNRLFMLALTSPIYLED